MVFSSEDMVMWIGRWSELSDVHVRQSQEVKMVDDARLRSGAVEWVGVILVGISSLRIPLVVSPSQSAKSWPLLSSVSLVCQR